MAFFSRNRKHVWIAVAAIALAGWSGTGCGISPASRMVFPPSPSQCVWEGVERVVAVGDLHGDYNAFVTILQAKGIIDENEKWIGGKAHLVQIGDVVDRMPPVPEVDENGRPSMTPRDIYILISRLEQEAAAAGGMVHFLPGNHEEMNLARVAMDYVGYVTLTQFKAFLHGAYLAAQERLTARMGDFDKDAHWKTLMDSKGGRDAYYDGFRDAVGAWIVGHNVIIKINGVVFVHGGITMEDSRRTLESINAKYREEFIQAMSDNQRFFQFVFQPNSPLWNRDLEAGENSSVTESDIKQILSNLKARAIVVGHTPQSNDAAVRFGGLVYMIDSYISSFYKQLSRPSALWFESYGRIFFGEVKRSEKKKRLDGFESFSRHSGDLFLRHRLAAAAGHA